MVLPDPGGPGAAGTQPCTVRRRDRSRRGRGRGQKPPACLGDRSLERLADGATCRRTLAVRGRRPRPSPATVRAVRPNGVVGLGRPWSGGGRPRSNPARARVRCEHASTAVREVPQSFQVWEPLGGEDRELAGLARRLNPASRGAPSRPRRGRRRTSIFVVTGTLGSAGFAEETAGSASRRSSATLSPRRPLLPATPRSSEPYKQARSPADANMALDAHHDAGAAAERVGHRRDGPPRRRDRPGGAGGRSPGQHAAGAGRGARAVRRRRAALAGRALRPRARRPASPS